MVCKLDRRLMALDYVKRTIGTQDKVETRAWLYDRMSVGHEVLNFDSDDGSRTKIPAYSVQLCRKSVKRVIMGLHCRFVFKYSKDRCGRTLSFGAFLDAMILLQSFYIPICFK